MRSLIRELAIVLCGSAGLCAAPQIKADKTSIDCGTVIEGKTDRLHADFTIRNTGDAPLHITTVRPGCGCTIVTFDTLVLPGKRSVIKSTVNLSGYHAGPLSKFMTVSSNAANAPSLKLTVTATIKSAIDVSTHYISLTARSSRIVVLTSLKKDLRVYSVTLDQRPSSSGMSGTISGDTLSIPFTWTPSDSLRHDGMHAFKLELTAPAIANRMSGTFVIATNHPELPEIRLGGAIEE